MENVFLVCFIVGLGLTVASLLLGSHSIHMGHSGAAGGHGADSAHGLDAGGLHFHLGFLNTMTVATFLAWFGGVGYLVVRYAAVGAAVGALVAVIAGVAGGGIVMFFLNHVLLRGQTLLADIVAATPGTTARVTSAIYPGYAGEVTYTLEGTTRTASARAADSEEIPRDTEVVILKYENGTAYVATWERALGDGNGARLPA